jgi:hypothetical protein
MWEERAGGREPVPVPVPPGGEKGEKDEDKGGEEEGKSE